MDRLNNWYDRDEKNTMTGKISGSRYADDSSLRASAGVAIYWNTVVGPLNFIWGFPISEESYDKDNNFKFSIGTSF